MTLYLIGGGALLLMFVLWKYGSLIKDKFKLKSAEREAKIHAKINEKNKEIDKESKEAYDELQNVDKDDMLTWLKKRMQLKGEKK